MDLLKKITEDWFNEFNTEIRRGKYPETGLNVGWFDALDSTNDRRTTTGQNKRVSCYAESIKERKLKAKSALALNDIP